MINWFRRKFKTSPQSEEQPSEVATPEIESTDVESEQPEATTSQEEQLLNLAKQAYANIQKRKTEESEVPIQASETTPVSEPIVEESPPENETIATIEEVETEPPTSTTPAWMRKSDRLEILKETAIETPTSEVKPAAVPEPGTNLEFDEEFVWSAKVLAAQGRKAEDISEEEINWLKRLRQGLGKTRRSLVNRLKAIVGQGPLNRDAVMEIEALLLQADVGIEATDYIITTLQNKLREEALPPEGAIAYLKEILREILDRPLNNFDNAAFVPEQDTFNIWLLTGVNGVGKTTTIGKLAHLAQKSGYSCLIAAADTFRAAAVEQVKVWGERSSTPVIANPGKNSDPAAVVFDGIVAAQSRNSQLLLVDTAGRLQNKKI